MGDQETLLARLRRASIVERTVRGVPLRIRGMTPAERLDFFERAAKTAESGAVDETISDAGLVSRFVVGDDGEPVFDPKTLEATIGAELMREIGGEVLEVSGLGQVAAEDARKNS